MRYTCEVTIERPRERVIELFDNPDNLSKWQSGLRSFEHVSGEPGQPGAMSKLVYDEGGRRMEMIETITTRNLPDEFSGTYDAPGVHNRMSNHFYEDGPDRTRWVADSEFQFTNLMMKAMGFLMRGAFPKRTQEMMEKFKAFAEST